MNGYIATGVVLIAASMALFNSGMVVGAGSLALAVGGILVALYGAFAPAARPRNTLPQRAPSKDDPWV